MSYPAAFLALLTIVSTTSIAAELNVFQAGEPISANEINQNFSELESRISSSQSQNKLYIFSSADMLFGTDGRKTMDAACVDTDPASSFCSDERISHAFSTTGIDFGPINGTSWMDSGIVTNSASFNCEGWASAASTGKAMMPSGRVTTASCTTSRAVLCCK